MLKLSQPTTPALASPKPVKKKQMVVEGSSPSVEISLPAGVTAFNDYKALVRGADQFLLLRDAQLLRDSRVLTTIDRGIVSTFQAIDDKMLEELRQRAAVWEKGV
ncbi:hypothetical protein ACOSQ3_010170 [Xanthoceras sorbifolium]